MKLLKELTENFGVDYPGHQEQNDRPYDRAIDMINAAVEYHTDNNAFDKIADVEGLVDFLKGRYQDFSQQIEQNVRDIIADEMDTTPQEQNSDEFHDMDTSPVGQENQEYEEYEEYEEYNEPRIKVTRIDDEENQEYEEYEEEAHKGFKSFMKNYG